MLMLIKNDLILPDCILFLIYAFINSSFTFHNSRNKNIALSFVKFLEIHTKHLLIFKKICDF